MPAIQPARLRHQVIALSQVYQQPDIFIKRLHDILGQYTDRTHKPGQSGEPKPLMAAYNVPPPVMRQIIAELKPVVQVYSDDTLTLCDLLWAQPFWELRYLAASLLGYHRTGDYAPVLERMNTWLSNGAGDQIARMILENATYQLRIEANSILFDWTIDLLASEQNESVNTGIKMLAILAREGALENLPTIYKLIGPYLRTLPQSAKPDLLNLLKELAHRSPGETAFVLRKNLESDGSPSAAWVIRQVLKAFPKEYQDNLRSAMRQRGLA